ncbi:apolipoprotein B-100 [Rhinatrema bivittatum]|uniref:apolipoprotein B-100 n=1 Tax=Rhinatrema bivittatum TaxID=194408 RepID=UPI00112C10EA|nr:apolipoprotein B-100 [Rhinatrema bivittatum]
MGTAKLWLLVLLASGCTIAQDDHSESHSPSCSKDSTRFKHLRKYVYNYEAETSNGVAGTADSQSGSKISCKVELEVPQLCSFVLRISQCTLREVHGINPEGKAMLKRSFNSDEFSNAMSKYELKFSIPDGKEVLLYPEKDEPVNILNIKRGIISALVVPVETENTREAGSMDTVYGKCSSEVAFKNKKGNTATEVTIDRNLQTCDRFTPIRDYISPIALIKGLNSPLSTLISSSQSCKYTIDAKRRHVSEAVCTEKHLFLPFSYKNQYGINAQVTQTLKLEEIPKINSRYFDEDASIKRGLALESADSKFPFKNGDVILKSLQELQKLSVSEQNQQRASLFHQFVTGLRGLHNDTLSSLVPRLIETSSPITLQALVQCGTLECISAILQIMRTGSISPVVVDVVTYTLGLLPSPCNKRLREVFNMAQYQQSRAAFYALSHTVNNFHKDGKTVTDEVRDVSDFMASLIENECSGDQDKTYLTLKAIGNMGKAMEDANPKLKSSLLKCIRSQIPTLSVQKAAIQAFRKMSITDEVRVVMLQTFQDNNAPADKRLAAYLMLMKNPSQSDLSKVTRAIVKDKNEQVKSYVTSHIANILSSVSPEAQELKGKVEEALKGSSVPTAIDFRKLSRNYQISKSIAIPGLDESVAAKAEGNLIFDSGSYMPEDAMLKATLSIFGEAFDMFEFGWEGKGLEPTLEALFGQQGFFPNSAMKALYWTDGKVPEEVSEILYSWFGVSRKNNKNQDLMREIMFNVEKLMKEVRSSDAPEAKAYMRILGEELGYIQLMDFYMLGQMFFKSLHASQELPGQIMKALSKGTEHDLFVHYIFMDNEFNLPTGAGFQLQVSLSGIVTPGAKTGLKIQTKNLQAEVAVKPAVAVEFVTHMGIHIPEVTRTGIQMNSNIYHESGLEARISVKEGLFKFTIPAPKKPIKLFSISNKLNLVSTLKTEAMASIIENRESSTSCSPLLIGINYCTNIGYSNASSSDSAPYYPLTGETRFEVELQPTGEVQEYSASASYKLQKQEGDLIDILKFAAQADGTNPSEATLIFKYNRNKMIFSSDFEVPDLYIDYGTNFRVNDESSRGKKSYAVILEVYKNKIPEVTLTGHIRYDGKREAMLRGTLSVPRLETEAKTQTVLQHSTSSITFQLDSSAAVGDFSVSQKTAFTYDSDKIEIEWNSGTSSDLKRIANLPNHFGLHALFRKPLNVQEYSDYILDHNVANTDMTLRHIASQSIVAVNKWIERAFKDAPYATTLQEKLHALQELNLQKLGLPPIILPMQLFLKSDGSVRYLLNKDSIIIDVPLPFGGKSSEELNIPRTIKTPSMDLALTNIRIEPQQFQIPFFTIPEYYKLRIPLLGVLDLSTNVHSNYYNWSASYTGGNTTKGDVDSFISNYQMKADSVLDLLSYSLDGNSAASYDPKNAFSWSFEGSLHHSLLDSSIKLSELYNFINNPIVRGSYAFDASSILGAQVSFSSSVQGTTRSNLFITETNMDGQLKFASLFARSVFDMKQELDINSLDRTIESNLKFESSYLQATNKITGRYANEALEIISNTDVQSDTLLNEIILNYRGNQLTFKSNTKGKYQNVVALNKIDLSISKQRASLRSEYQADYKHIRYYTLLSGSLNSKGLELNTDINFNNQANRAAHKATLRVNLNGLSTSATTNINYSPLIFGNEFNAGIDMSGAIMKISANGHYQEHNAKFNMDGKVALMEISLGSVYQSTILHLDSKNILNFKMNKDGLKFSNNLVGSYDDMKLEHNNDLSIVGSTMVFSSKFENRISNSHFNKYNFDFQIQPYMLSSNLNNDLVYGDIHFANKGQLQLELFKMNLNGNMRGAYRADEIKHTYTITYADLTTNFKTNTVANIKDIALNHRVNAEIAGLSAAFSSSTNCEAKSLRFSHIVTSVIIPFSVTFDAHTTGDGRFRTQGDHAGQLYSKFLLKAEPLAFTFSHDYRGSTEHTFDNGNIHNTLIDNKVNALFSPAEQSGSWKLKSQLDKTAYNQDASAYNNAEKIGMELNGVAQVDLSMLDSPIDLLFAHLNIIDALDLRDSIGQLQEFSISGSVTYDKNQDVHVINLPFLENLPVYFEQIRRFVLSSLQAIQKYLKSINIDQYIKKYKSTLDKIPHQMNDYIHKFDLEGKVHSAKEKFIALIKEYRITAEDLQNVLNNAKVHFTTILSKLQEFLTELEKYIKDNYDLNDLQTAIQNIINQIVEGLKTLDEKYNISKNTINTIQDLQQFVDQFDVNEIGSSAAVWVQNMDNQYEIKAKVKEKLQQLKNQLQDIDIQSFAENLKNQIQAIKIQDHIKTIIATFPTKKLSNIIDQVKDFVIALLEDYEVIEKINAVGDRIQDLIVKFEIDKQVQVFMDKFVELVNQYRVKETIKNLTNWLKNVNVKSYFGKIVNFVDDAIKQVKSYDFKKLLDEVNRFLNMVIKKLKSFDYNESVDYINQNMRELTQKINDEIKTFEIPQKAEALKQYIKEVWLATLNYIDQIKTTKLATIIEWFKDLLNSTALNELKKRILENLEHTRDTIYTMDIQKEFQRYLQQVSRVYIQLVSYISDLWNTAAEEITIFAEKFDINDWAENVKTFVENGLIIPEIKTGIINIPSFEVSLRALREATFQTPDFIVPLTDLHIKSVTINMKKLKDMKIPTRFTTPEFTVLNTFKIRAYTIDLNEIKQKIVNIMDQMISSEFQWPSSEVYFRDLKINDMPFADISFPEIYIPDLQVPSVIIPKLNLDDFQIPNIQIPEFQLPRIAHTVSLPTFGKFTGTLKVASPFFTLMSTSIVQNATISERSPEFVASLSAQTISKVELLAFTIDADARISAPNMAQLLLKESLKVSHRFVRIEHNSETTFSDTDVIGKAKTLASLNTEKNLVELQNDMTVKLEKKITVDMNTKYIHKLNIPQAELSSQLEFQNEANVLIEGGKIAYTSSGKGNWKWTYPSFSDEGTHESNIKFTIKGPVIEFSGSNKILDKYLKLEQSLNYESSTTYGTLEINSKAESQYVGLSVLNVKAKGDFIELTVGLEGTHKAELVGRAIGTIDNTVSFLMQLSGINLSTNNNGNLKVSFPMKLIGKIEFANNYDCTLNSAVQQVKWQATGRFNQYKYSHIISAGNNEEKIEAQVEMNGEANLDFLTHPVTIPAFQIPFITVETVEIKDISLWEETGLKNFLRTTKQSYDLNVKLQYQKNKDSHALVLPLATVYESLNQNIKSFNNHFERGRDYTLDFLMDSYNKAKAKFDNYKVEASAGKLPRHFRIPGYTIPVANIEVSPLTAELPEFGYVIPKEISTPSFMVPGVGFSVPSYTLVLPSMELPVLHVPNNLRRLSLPKFKMPNMQNSILIPAMGNFTCDFSFKSNVIYLNINAGLYNQSDISARFSASSTSIFEALQFTLDGTTSLTRKRGLKLATGLSLKNVYAEGNHDSSLTLTKKNMEASATTNARINMPILKMNIVQKISGNTKSKPIVSSEFSLNYEFTDSIYNNKAKGLVDHKMKLEGLTSYFSLETTTKGDISGVFLSDNEFSGKLTNEANTYLNADGVRSSVKFEGNSKVGEFLNVDIKENLALQVSTQRLYAIWEHNGGNSVFYSIWYPPNLRTKGNQNCKLKLEVTPWNLWTQLELQVNQSNRFQDEVSISQAVSLKLNMEKQELGWKGEGHIHSLAISHDMQFENGKKDVQFSITGSLQGHADFLTLIVLPIYDKSVWDILKFDSTTSYKEKHYLTVSTTIVYTKNKDGFLFPIPVNELADGFMVIPELNLIKIPKKISSLPFDFTVPLLPKVTFPKVDIGTKYTILEEDNIPFFEVTMHKFEIMLSQFTLPKSISNLNFNAIANKIADFDLPTITIPEQKIKIPPLKISLPGGLFIPAFGAFSGSVKIASPIYNITWSTTLKNITNAFESSIDASCSSTLRFLEYDLDALSTGAFQDSTFKLNGKGSFSHPDLSMEWQDDFSFSGPRLPSYNIMVAITSPTFVNAQIHSQHDKKKISSYVSSPSTGLLGLLIEKDASIIQGKLYMQYPSSPEKDVIILKGEISLKNPEQIQIKTYWKDEAAEEILTGLKDRIPAISDALYKCINNYHREHFGMDMKTASLKIKDSMQNNVDKAYEEATKKIDQIDKQLRKASSDANEKYQEMKNKAQEMYQDAADQAVTDYSQYRKRFFDASVDAIREYQKKVKALLDATIELLKVMQFQLPGDTKRYTGEELYSMATKQVETATELFLEKLQQYYDSLIQYINNLEVKVPGTNTNVKGKQVLRQIKNLLKELQQRIKKIFNDIQKVNFEEKLKELQGLVQDYFLRAEKIMNTLQTSYEDIYAQTNQIYSDAFNSAYAKQLESFAEEVQEYASHLQGFSQNWFQDLSEKLQQTLIYVKALREEYLDPNVVGWTVKYYEIEDKIIELLKNIIEAVKDLHTKYIGDSATFVSNLGKKTKELIGNHGQEYYNLVGGMLADAEGKGKQRMTELSSMAQEKIQDWSTAVKMNAAQYSDFIKVRIQDTYVLLYDSYEQFIAEIRRIIDLFIEKYNSILDFIMQLIPNIQTSNLQPNIAFRKGELKIDMPHPFDWQSFDEMPRLKDDEFSKKMQIVHTLIKDGIDKSSEKWSEIQNYIDKQLAEGKLNVQQIIENIQKRIQN